MQTLDLIALGIIGLAAIRGLFIGLTREVSSIAALAAGCFGARFLSDPAASVILDLTQSDFPRSAAFWIAAGVLFFACALLVSLLGRMLARGVKAAGLQTADRLGGGTLGFAEGALVVGITIAILLATLGDNHTWLRRSKSVEIFQRAQQVAAPQIQRAIDVASPPPEH